MHIGPSAKDQPELGGVYVALSGAGVARWFKGSERVPAADYAYSLVQIHRSNGALHLGPAVPELTTD